MSSEESQTQQMKPYIIAAIVLFVILLAIVMWPTSDDAKLEPISAINPVEEPVADNGDTGITDMVSPDIFIPPTPEELRLDDNYEVQEFEAQEVIVDAPLDASDASVKSALIAVAKSPIFGKLLVNDTLIQKFVINVHSLADHELATKSALVVPPTDTFKTYEQAERTWIDKDSFNRYTPYVEALESVEPDELLEIYDTYKETIVEKYNEISRPGANFDSTLINAINELLDTPKVPVPIEVFSESVMFKFKDPRIEALSAPQKQLIRTGPENMRRIKEILRSLRDELEARQ